MNEKDVETVRHEAIMEKASPKTHDETLVCVHGASVGAWSFNGFSAVANTRGFDVVLMNLRGHGQSQGEDMTGSWTLDDYADDVISVLETIKGPVTIVAHSMGGAVVQKALSRLPGHVRHVLLLCSPPPGGIDSDTPLGMFYSDRLKMVRHHRRTHPGQNLGALVKSVLFDQSIPEELATDILSRFMRESSRATSGLLAPLVGQRPERLPRITVAGVSNDRLITPDILETTAAFYGTGFHIVGHMPHFLFFHPEADMASNAILDLILDPHLDTKGDSDG
jgi:pimeloyl-ACP methyl ester carboxylesterase